MYGVSFRFEDISDAIALREATGQIPRASPAGDLEIAPHGVGPNRSARHATLHSSRTGKETPCASWGRNCPQQALYTFAPRELSYRPMSNKDRR